MWSLIETDFAYYEQATHTHWIGRANGRRRLYESTISRWIQWIKTDFGLPRLFLLHFILLFFLFFAPFFFFTTSLSFSDFVSIFTTSLSLSPAYLTFCLVYSIFPSLALFIVSLGWRRSSLSLSVFFSLFFWLCLSSCALSLIFVRVPLSYVSPTKINWHRLGTQPYHDIHCQYWVLTYTPPPHT